MVTMKVTLLLENNSLYSRYLNAEHGFSAWIEDEDIKVIYDCGYSNKFISNAEELNIDLCKADYIVLSHNHEDHTGGFKYLIQYYKERAMARKPILLFTSQEIFKKRYTFIENKSVGLDVDQNTMLKYFNVKIAPNPLWVTKNLCYMGICERSNDFEHVVPQVPKKKENDKWVDDVVDEDTQFCYKHKNGKEASIISGCAHYGICNIMEYAKKLTGAQHINTYIGGSHLRIDEVPQSQLDKTCEYVEKEMIKAFYICHDTCLACRHALGKVSHIKEAGVGLVVKLDE